jgi:hypothetical protein
MAWAMRSTEVLRERWRVDENALWAGIDFIGIRCKHEVGAVLAAEFEVSGDSAGVPLVVLFPVELKRVHEDGDYHAAALGARAVDQRSVPGVQRAHGGN